MSYGSILADLTEGLQDAGRKNFSVADSDEAMENIAKPIAKAVYDGVDFTVKGSATVSQINALHGMEAGDSWAVKDSGTIANPDGSSVGVTAGDIVRWDGEKWSVFLHIDLSGYVTDEELAAAIALEVTARQSADAALGRRIDQIPVIEVDPGLDPESANPVENRAVTNAMNGKQDQLTEMTDQEVEYLIGSLQ